MKRIITKTVIGSILPLSSGQKEISLGGVNENFSLFCKLCDSKILIKKQLKKEQMDRANFYTINYEKLDEIHKKLRQKLVNHDTAKFAVSKVQSLHDHNKENKLRK